MLVTYSGSQRASGIFFCVATQTESTPRIPTVVSPDDLAALMAYSTWYSLPSGEKMEMCRSYPADLDIGDLHW